MPTQHTSIKVPRPLRDRLAERARREHATLAAVISRALDESEERDFWSRVRSEHAALSAGERAGYESNHAGVDDLTDPIDTQVTKENAW
ncbi:hypothetical protein ACX80B_05315 [Arthrobacter monumenti]